MTERPSCPRCAAPVDRMQTSKGVVAVYPCRHWLTPADARTLASTRRDADAAPTLYVEFPGRYYRTIDDTPWRNR